MVDYAHGIMGGEGRSMDGDMRHICQEVLSICPGMRAKIMTEYGICTVMDLMQTRGQLEKDLVEWMSESASNRRKWNGLREGVIRNLLLVIKWRERNQSANIIEDFDERVLYKMEDDDNFCDDYIRKNILGSPNSIDNATLSRELLDDGELLLTVIRKCTDTVMEPPILREWCGKFDSCSFLDKCIRHFVKQSCGLEKEMIAVLAAPTQSGKSGVEGVVQSMCGLWRIPLVILTKGVGESIDLHAKLVRLSDGTLMKEKHIVVGESFEWKNKLFSVILPQNRT
jgi:hypothetical protein